MATSNLVGAAIYAARVMITEAIFQSLKTNFYLDPRKMGPLQI